MSPREWPSWWDWDLELSPHVLKRMVDRQFTEVDLRRMLEYASGLREDTVEGRWVVEARHGRLPWEIIVEPEAETCLLIVITAYPLG